ncbi:DcrB/PsbP domain-containing protein [Pseudomonas sp. S2_A05]
MIARLARPFTGDSHVIVEQKAVVLMLAAVAGFAAINAHAAKEKVKTEKVSLLDGKFAFVLPKGFVADPLPASPSGAKGTMYTNQTTKTVVIAAENQIPAGQNVKDNDGEFLDGSVSSFIDDQRKALPDFNKLSEKSLTQKGTGLGLRQVDSTATQGGGQTLNTTLLAGSGTKMALVQVISRASDKKAHDALIKAIVKD